MEDYGIFHNLERYVSDKVHRRFHEHGSLDSFDFFCIIIWKANRAKSKVAERVARLDNLKGKGLDGRIRNLTETLFKIQENKGRMRYLMKGIGFRLPMASSILTVLYPDDFTVYDVRVCSQLRDEKTHRRLANKVDFDSIWTGYIQFKKAVEEETPSHLSLRDKDRYLWGKSFHDQLRRDLEHGFNVKE